jgi:hypothetical protein
MEIRFCGQERLAIMSERPPTFFEIFRERDMACA